MTASKIPITIPAIVPGPRVLSDLVGRVVTKQTNVSHVMICNNYLNYIQTKTMQIKKKDECACCRLFRLLTKSRYTTH